MLHLIFLVVLFEQKVSKNDIEIVVVSRTSMQANIYVIILGCQSAEKYIILNGNLY